MKRPYISNEFFLPNVKLQQNFQQFIDEVDLGHNSKIFAHFRQKTWQEENRFFPRSY